MTRFFPKSCQHCGGDFQFIPAFASEPDDRLVCFQCSRAICREPKDAAAVFHVFRPTQCPECGCPRACLGHRENARRGVRGILVFCNCESMSEALV